MSPCPGPSGSTEPRRLPKILYNLTSKFKSALSRHASHNTYARVVRNLATPRTPEKRRAISRLGLIQQNGTGRLQKCRKNLLAVRQKTKIIRPRMGQQMINTKVQTFYTRYDVSRQLPHQRYATKAGAAYVMNITIRGAYRQFLQENPGCSIGYTKFALLRPKFVKKLGSVPAETCLCIYCLNIRYKLTTLNRALSRNSLGWPLPEENKVLDWICCPRDGGARWHKPACISGDCDNCKDSLKQFKRICSPILGKTVSWSHWGRGRASKLFKLDVFSRTGLVTDLLKEMEADIDHPTQQTSFRKHLMTVFWQYDQYRRLLKFSLEEDEAMLVMDFAENRKACYNAEVKSAHFSKEHCTLHPVIAFYKNSRGQLVRHSLMYLSDDLGHDYHLVNHFTVAALEFLKQQVRLRRVGIFSDGCAAQYKGRGTFADLSLLSGCHVSRAYFGSEHGKGEADGETGVFSQQQVRAVQGGTNMRNAQDIFEWAQQSMSKPLKGDDLVGRTFFLVRKEEVLRQRPETVINTVPGTRSYHEVHRVDDYIIKCRKLACFCSACKCGMDAFCINKPYVGDFVVHKLKDRNPSALELGFVAQPESHPTEAAHEAAIPRPVASTSYSQEAHAEDNAVSPSPACTPTPSVGDYVKITFKIGKKSTKEHVCVVVESTVPLEIEGDFMVPYMRKAGNYYTLPAAEESFLINSQDENVLAVKQLSPPLIDNRGRHFFNF